MDDARLGAWLDAGAVALRLPVDETNRAAVLLNLQRLAAIAARLEAVELEPAVEPVVVFVR